MPQTLPIGIYEQVVNQIIQQEINTLQGAFHIEKNKLDPVASEDVLSAYLARILREVLAALDRKEHLIADRVFFCNELLRYIAGYMASQEHPDHELIKRLDHYWINKEGEMLLSILEKKPHMADIKPIRPSTSIATQSLFTGASHEPKMEAELRTFTESGGKLRIITTSYIGATDYKAVKWLSSLPNTEIKISYDTDNPLTDETRLKTALLRAKGQGGNMGSEVSVH